MHTHCWVLAALRTWDIPSSRPPSEAVKCVLGVVELTGVAFPVAQLTGEGREGGRGAEQEERLQETWGSRGTEAESLERGKSNSGPSCAWKRTGIAGISYVGVASGTGTGHCLLLQGFWALGCQISVQTAEVGLGHKGEMFQLLEPYRVFFLFLQEENEQQEPLQKREDEVKERGMTVLELKNLLEQQHLRQAKERYKLVPVLEQGIGHSHGEAVDVNVMLHQGCDGFQGCLESEGDRSRRL